MSRTLPEPPVADPRGGGAVLRELHRPHVPAGGAGEYLAFLLSFFLKEVPPKTRPSIAGELAHDAALPPSEVVE